MIQFSRTSSIAPGKIVDALAFAKEVSEYLYQHYDVKTQVAMPVGSNPHRISWRSAYPSMAALDGFHVKLLTDANYLELVARASSIFVAGSTNDEIWRSI